MVDRAGILDSQVRPPIRDREPEFSPVSRLFEQPKESLVVRGGQRDGEHAGIGP
jgi:hypothetical protein